MTLPGVDFRGWNRAIGGPSKAEKKRQLTTTGQGATSGAARGFVLKDIGCSSLAAPSRSAHSPKLVVVFGLYLLANPSQRVGARESFGTCSTSRATSVAVP